jgi:hypothetical protein
MCGNIHCFVKAAAYLTHNGWHLMSPVVVGISRPSANKPDIFLQKSSHFGSCCPKFLPGQQNVSSQVQFNCVSYPVHNMEIYFVILSHSNQKGRHVKNCSFQRKRKLFCEKEKRKPFCSPNKNHGNKLKIKQNIE